MHVTLTDRPDVAAARAALFFAHILGGPSARNSSVTVVIDGRTAVPEAAEMLAATEKPLECHAQMDNDGLTLVCARIKRDPVRERQRLSAFITHEERLAVGQSGGDILLLGKTEGILIGLKAFEKFVRDYDFGGTYLWSVRRPTASDRREGAALVISVSAPAPSRHGAERNASDH